jgi:hypothetical protein
MTPHNQADARAGAAAGCDLLISFFQDQKISACGSSDRGAKGYQNVVRNPT